MFGVQKLKDQVECLSEERNYFRSKFLEQVSEIASLKEALQKSEKEISRLRRELMDGSNSNSAAGLDSPVLVDNGKYKRASRLSLKVATSPSSSSPRKNQTAIDNNEEKKEDAEDATGVIQEVLSGLSVDDDAEELSSSSEDEDEDEQAAIRNKAEQLVRWASYRQEVLSPERSPPRTP